MKPLARVWLATAGYAALYTALGTVRYATYRSGSDLGLFTQSIADAFGGFSNTTEGGNHFIVHFSPILYLCAPLLLAVRTPLALVVIQAVACALAAPPLFLIARKRLPESLAAGVAFVVLVYPPLAGVTFADFHENAFVAAATLWLAWAVDARRWPLAALFLILDLCIKEDQAPIVGFAALALLVAAARRRDRATATFAGAALASAAATFVFFFEVVRPWAGARDVWGPAHFYTWTHIVDPRGSAPWYSIGRPAYFLEAVVPLAFVCFLSPTFVLALPGFAEVLSSHESITYTMGQHYAAVWIPYVLLAFAFGVVRLHAMSPARARTAVWVAAGLCLAVLAFASPTHWGHYLRVRTAHDALLDRTLAELPPDLSVGAQDAVYSHLGFDPHAELGLARAPRYALFDTRDVSAYLVSRWRPVVLDGVARGAWRRVFARDGIELYERVRGTVARSAEGRARGRRNGAAAARARARRVVDRGRRHE